MFFGNQQELKEQHKQRITGFVDSQSSVLAGIQEHVDGNGKTSVDINKIAAQISHLQAIVREQLESTDVVASEEVCCYILQCQCHYSYHVLLYNVDQSQNDAVGTKTA